ncbi:MAG: hypothetical protein ACKO96_16735, partial [Flammeovirgaceae bacterium]
PKTPKPHVVIEVININGLIKQVVVLLRSAEDRAHSKRSLCNSHLLDQEDGADTEVCPRTRVKTSLGRIPTKNNKETNTQNSYLTAALDWVVATET